MLNKEYLIPFIAIAVIFPLLISPTTVTAIDLADQKFKRVVTFELNTNPNVIRGSYEQFVSPAINNIFDDLGTDHFGVIGTGQGQGQNPNGYFSEVHVIQFHVQGTNPQSADSVFQIYPLVRVSGVNTMSDAQWDIEHDMIIAMMRSEIINFLQAEGATNVKTLIHFSFGGVRLNEGF